MKIAFCYLATVLIWGSTWLGIKLQLGVVDPVVSVAYRFALAAVLLLAWCRLRGLNMRFSLQQHGFMLLQGGLLFGCNYLLFYLAEQYLTSGLAAVIFSTVLWMNIGNGFLFLGSPLNRRVVGGGALGLVGICLVFLPELRGAAYGQTTWLGIGLCLAATLLASLGNITSARNQKSGLPIVQSNGYGMAYGSLVMFALALVGDRQLTIDPSPSYLGSLLYLAIFGSIIAFGCYLYLVGVIGADRAAYSTLLFPLVALVISTIWEDYSWSVLSLCGVALIVAGNFFILGRRFTWPGLAWLRRLRGAVVPLTGQR